MHSGETLFLHLRLGLYLGFGLFLGISPRLLLKAH